MNTSPIWMPALKKLAEEHYDVAVLERIQSEATNQAVENRMLKGMSIDGVDAMKSVLDEANALLPGGLDLQSLYFQRRANLALTDIQDLEATAETLVMCAEQLEKISSKVLARNLDVATFAQVEHSIGERYAQLIRGARTLEDAGVVSVLHFDRLVKLTERPFGPLSAFFDKAMALVDHQDSMPKMRMAA